MNKHDRMYEAIRRQGEALRELFGLGVDVDVVKLSKSLRRLEREAARVGLRLCNGPEYETEDGADVECEVVLRKVDKLTGYKAKGIPVFVNRDPRGYALKVEDGWMAEYRKTAKNRLHTDWGGYGILAPDYSEE